MSNKNTDSTQSPLTLKRSKRVLAAATAQLQSRSSCALLELRSVPLISLLVPKDEEDLGKNVGPTGCIHSSPVLSTNKLTTAAEAIQEPLGGLLKSLSAQHAQVDCEANETSEPASYAAMHLYSEQLQSLLQETIANAALKPADEALGNLRSIKTDVEISRLRTSGEVAGAVNTADLKFTSQPPDAPESYPARDVVDGGFLQLVRYGILCADGPLIVDTVRVIDATVKAETPLGPCWHRYDHDGYGQKRDGRPCTSCGEGRPWPLLTGERGHYELAAGNNARVLLHTMENFSNSTKLLPEQIWNGPDLPAHFCVAEVPSHQWEGQNHRAQAR